MPCTWVIAGYGKLNLKIKEMKGASGYLVRVMQFALFLKTDSAILTHTEGMPTLQAGAVIPSLRRHN